MKRCYLINEVILTHFIRRKRLCLRDEVVSLGRLRIEDIANIDIVHLNPLKSEPHVTDAHDIDQFVPPNYRRLTVHQHAPECLANDSSELLCMCQLLICWQFSGVIFACIHWYWFQSNKSLVKAILSCLGAHLLGTTGTV